MALGAASVAYNEVFRSQGKAKWFPEMRSGIANAYASGTSQGMLLLQSNFITGVGPLAYDGTTALMNGRYGDLAEMAGGIIGGFAIGKGVQKFGGYGLRVGSIGGPQFGPMANQRGTIGLKLVTPDSGPVIFRAPPGATAEEIAQIQAYVNGSNEALKAGQLSPTGRVSTKGELRTDASLAAALERARSASEGIPYQGHAGHVPDTTWTGNAQPHSWLDLSPRVNSSIGGQSPKYPVGYRPTEFIFEGPK